MRTDDAREAWQAIVAVGADQHGVVTAAQLGSHFTRHQVARLAQRGHLVRTGIRGVWRIPGPAIDWLQELSMCCIAGGPQAVASHLSAARLWDLEGVVFDRVEVTLPRNRSQRWTGQHAVFVHRATIPPMHVRQRNGIPVTSVPRTLIDLAPRLPPDVLTVATDGALRRRILTIQQLAAARERTQAPGVTALDPIIELRLEAGTGESVWEDRLWKWIADAGLPRPVRQYPVDLPSGAVRLDLAYPNERVAIEFDGYTWHRGRARFDRDRVRTSELSVAGWVIVAVTSAQTRQVAVNRIRLALLSRGWAPAA